MMYSRRLRGHFLERDNSRLGLRAGEQARAHQRRRLTGDSGQAARNSGRGSGEGGGVLACCAGAHRGSQARHSFGGGWGVFFAFLSCLCPGGGSSFFVCQFLYCRLFYLVHVFYVGHPDKPTSSLTPSSTRGNRPLACFHSTHRLHSAFVQLVLCCSSLALARSSWTLPSSYTLSALHIDLLILLTRRRERRAPVSLSI